MGSWYIFCYLGFFPNAGQDLYYLSAPRCTSAEIRLADGKTLRIKANAAKGNVYIKSLKINGQEWKSPFITHSILSKGGLWEFDLTDSPLY
jgi:putative alpha-1,2-mannosidase